MVRRSRPCIKRAWCCVQLSSTCFRHLAVENYEIPVLILGHSHTKFRKNSTNNTWHDTIYYIILYYIILYYIILYYIVILCYVVILYYIILYYIILYYIILYYIILYYIIYLTAIWLSPGGSTHLHTNNTKNNTVHKFGRVLAVPRLCEVYPDICLTTEEKARTHTDRMLICPLG